MAYLIKYWPVESLEDGEAEASLDPMDLEIIENPKDLIENGICHDINGNAWNIIRIIKPGDTKGLDSLGLEDTEALNCLSLIENEVIFILEGVDLVGVMKDRARNPKQPRNTAGRQT